jgi:hypothetical protein
MNATDLQGSSLRLLGTCLLIGTSLTLPAGAQEEPAPETLRAAFASGKPYVNLRYRFENVDEDGSSKDAHASTLRTVLGWESAGYRGWSIFGEAENVAVLGNDLYDNRGAGSLSNGVADRPVVADPAITEINQAGVRFRNDDWTMVAGRQELVLGDTRFVGNVGWRQNHQSFNALRIDNQSLERARVGYAYVDRVQRIFGDSLDLSGHLLNAALDAGRAGTLTVYGYLLDYRDPGAAGNSTATWGAELSGKRALSDALSLLYEIEYAHQSDYADNPANVDAGYGFVMLGAAWSKINARLGWEILEGAPGDGRFTTPLATLHKFNGWADKFLATPANGLEDRYLQVDGKIRSLEWLARVHDFDAESSGASYGSELDLQLLYRTTSQIVVALTGALYDADSFSTDTEKWSLWATYSF